MEQPVRIPLVNKMTARIVCGSALGLLIAGVACAYEFLVVEPKPIVFWFMAAIVLPIGAYALYRFSQQIGKSYVVDESGIRFEDRGRTIRFARWPEIEGYAFRVKKRQAYFEIDIKNQAPMSVRLGSTTFDSPTELQGLIRELDRRMPVDALRGRPPRPDDRVGRLFYDAYNDPKPIEMVDGVWYRLLDPGHARAEARWNVFQDASLVLAAAAQGAVMAASAQGVLAWFGGAIVAAMAAYGIDALIRDVTRYRTADSEWRIKRDVLEVRTGKAVRQFSLATEKLRWPSPHLTQYGNRWRCFLIDRRLLVPSSDYIPIEERRANKAQSPESAMLSPDGEPGELERLLSGDPG